MLPNDGIQDERARPARLGRATRFYKRLDCDIPAGRLKPSILEVYGRREATFQRSGELFCYCLRGRVRLTAGGESCVIHKGGAATLDRTVHYTYEPLSPVAPRTAPRCSSLWRWSRGIICAMRSDAATGEMMLEYLMPVL